MSLHIVRTLGSISFRDLRASLMFRKLQRKVSVKVDPIEQGIFCGRHLWTRVSVQDGSLIKPVEIIYERLD